MAVAWYFASYEPLECELKTDIYDKGDKLQSSAWGKYWECHDIIGYKIPAKRSWVVAQINGKHTDIALSCILLICLMIFIILHHF